MVSIRNFLFRKLFFFSNSQKLFWLEKFDFLRQALELVIGNFFSVSIRNASSDRK